MYRFHLAGKAKLISFIWHLAQRPFIKYRSTTERLPQSTYMNHVVPQSGLPFHQIQMDHHGFKLQ